MIKTQTNRDKPLGLVATSDIGWFGGQAFLQSESHDYKNQAIGLQGDNLTYDQMNDVFKEKLGYPVPTTFEFVARFIKWMSVEMGTMFKWFDEEGYDVDVSQAKRLNPNMLSLGDWLVKEGGFSVQK